MKTFPLIAALCLTAAPVLAGGDATKGADDFKRCKACHSIVAPDGTAIQKGGKIGPNLYGVVGRAVASLPDFKYGDGIKAVGAKGVVWDEAMIAAYVTDPGVWIKTQTGDDKAVAKMAFKMATGGEDVAAYLASVK
ncbi:cytochrome C [bacterium]|nr:cytochrome C [bacterium]